MLRAASGYSRGAARCRTGWPRRRIRSSVSSRPKPSTGRRSSRRSRSGSRRRGRSRRATPTTTSPRHARHFAHVATSSCATSARGPSCACAVARRARAPGRDLRADLTIEALGRPRRRRAGALSSGSGPRPASVSRSTARCATCEAARATWCEPPSHNDVEAPLLAA